MMTSKNSFVRENLRTVVKPDPLVPPVSYTDRILLTGSCFTEHIGNRLKMLKFSVDLNPFGIVYNPISIADQLQYLLNPADFTADDLVFHQDLWHSWMHHSRFSHPDAAKLIETLNNQALNSGSFLEHAGVLFLTFGTTECYYLKADNRLVSNCHQIPADQFYTRRPGPQELAGIWIPLVEALKTRNPGLRICLTISPIRYFKEGPTGNQLSKATLFLFISLLMKAYPDLFYFPAYEIFMDDLRDYRFYDEDLMHPGSAGLEYVWSRFMEACIDPAVYGLMEEVEAVMKAAGHRPGVHLTDAHRRFVAHQSERIRALIRKYPFLNFAEELEVLENQLQSDHA